MDFRRTNIDLVGKQNLWFGISLAVIVVGLVSMVVFGLNLGIDFKGGGQLQYRIPAEQRPAGGQEQGLIDETKTALEQKGLRGTRVQISGGDTIVVATDARGDAELRSHDRIVREVLSSRFKVQPATLEPIGSQLVGPVIGEELRKNAVKGVLLGVLFIAAWIWIRYNFAGDGLRYAVACIVALVHDVIVLIGLFALIGGIDRRVEMDGSFIAALLTVVGYSINDSVVIFDRIRENLRKRRREPFETVVNDSLLETMSRSINTGLTVLIMLFVLLMFGGESIYNFVLAMLVGIASGLYSSIFNASMVLTAWHKYDEKKAAGTRAAGGRNVTVRDATRRAPLPSQQRPTLPSTASSLPATPAATPVPSTGAATEPLAANEDTSGGIDSGAIETPSETPGSPSTTSRPAAARPGAKARARRRY
jgi:preprotein translocase subunit SecF